MSPRQRMFLRIIWKSFFHRLSRVIIASLSISVGAATLCSLGIIAITVPTQIQKELRSYGANMVVLSANNESLSEQVMTQADTIVGSDSYGRAAYTYGNLLYNQQPVAVMATRFNDARTVRPYWKIDGREPKENNELILGDNLAKRYRLNPGDQIGLTEPTKAEGAAEQMKITGILRTGGPEDDLITMPIKTYEKFNPKAENFSLIEYSIKPEHVTQTAQKLNQNIPGIDAEVVRRTSHNEDRIGQTLSSLIWVVSGIIIVLTVISIYATLNSIISERAKEIGLKKALGGLGSDVIRELLGESVLLGIFGGAIGAAAGVLLADVISFKVFAIYITPNWWIVTATLIFSIAVAVVGCIIPARRISRIQPINVLGGE